MDFAQIILSVLSFLLQAFAFTETLADCPSFTVQDAVKCSVLNVASYKYGATCSSSHPERVGFECVKSIDGQWDTEYRQDPMVGEYIQIIFAWKYLVNRVKLTQNIEPNGKAQISTVKLIFSDSSTETLSLKKNNGVADSFSFVARETSSIKIETTAFHSNATNTHGFKEIEVYHDTCLKDQLCDRTKLGPGAISEPVAVSSDYITFGVNGTEEVNIILSRTSEKSEVYEFHIGTKNNSETILYRKSSADSTALKNASTPAILSKSALRTFWIDYSTRKLTFGSGSEIILSHCEEEADYIRVNFVAFRNTLSQDEANFVLCQRQDFCYGTAKHFWPLDKVIGNAVIDLITSNRSAESSFTPLEMESNFYNLGPSVDEGSLVAGAVELTKNINLGSFSESCASNIAKCISGVTISFWLNVKQLALTSQFLICSSSVTIRVDQNIVVILMDGSTEFKVEAPFRVNKWQHMAVTWKRDQGAILLLDFTRKFLGSSVQIPSSAFSSNLILGRCLSSSPGLLVSNLAFWDKALSSSEIQRIGRCSTLRPALSSGLSMHNGFIPDDAITATSSLDKYSGPERSRALLATEAGFSGGWRAAIPDTKQYLQVDLLQPKVISSFIVQSPDCSCSDRVVELTVSYSSSGATWRTYKESGATKVFAVNSTNPPLPDSENCFLGNLTARLLRFHPTSWTGNISMRLDIKTSEHAFNYVGCHKLSPAPTAASGYDPLTLTTEKCITVCGKMGLLFAALTNGDVCACITALPAASSRYGNKRCFVPCKGDLALMCGGTNHYSLYKVQGKFKFDYVLTVPSMAETFTEITASVTYHEGAVNYFDFGEGSTYRTSNWSIGYIYRRHGIFKVLSTTKLGEWGEPQQYVQEKSISVVSRIGSVKKLNCSNVVEAFKIEECILTIDEGSNISIRVTELSGDVSSIATKDAWIETAGQSLNFDSTVFAIIQNSMDDATYILPTLTFTRAGILKAWELNVSAHGFIKLQVWRPVCLAISEERYCYKGGECITAAPPCPVYNASNDCANPGVFCKSATICNENSLLCPDVQTNVTDVTITGDYEVIHDILVHVTNGVHVIHANKNNASLPFPSVRAGDIVAFGISAMTAANLVSLDSLTKSFRYNRKTFSYGDIIKTDANADIENLGYLFGINAYYSIPTIFRQSSNYPVGIWKRHLTFRNELGVSNFMYSVVATEKIQNVTWDVPKNFASNLTTFVTIAPHSGYNITYKITFDNSTTQERFVTRANEAQVFSHIYAEEGEETILLLIINALGSVAMNCTVEIQKPILKAGLYPIAASKVGRMTRVEWWARGGSHVIVNITFGDGNVFSPYNITFNLNRGVLVGSYNHTYGSEGHFNVKLFLFNKVSNFSLHGLAIVEYPILGLTTQVIHFARDIEVNETVTFNTSLKQGSFPKLLIDYGDGSNDYLSTLSAQHSYSLWRFYLVNITVINHVSTQNDSVLIQVHKPVQPLVGFTIHCPFANISATAKIELTKLTGTDFNCDWNFGDGMTARQNYSTAGGTMFHVYTAVGTFMISINCTNRLYNTTASTSVVVQEPIKNLFLGIPMAQSVLKDLDILFQVSAGTNITFNTTWKSYDSGIENFAVIVAGKTHNACCIWPMVIRKKHFVNAEKLRVEVSFWNLVTPKEKRVFTVHINEPISNLTLFNTDVHVPVGVPSNFHVKLSIGSNVTLTYNFGNATIYKVRFSGRFPQSIPAKNHSWKNDGEYLVIITAVNFISSCSVFKKIFVEHPVKDVVLLSNSPQILPPGNISWWLSIQPGTHPPTNAVFDFDHGDKKITTNNLFGNTRNRTHFHIYKIPGTVIAIVTIRNNISSVTLQGLADVQRTIKNLQALTFHTDGHAGKGAPGAGSNQDTFPFEFSVNHTANHSDGTNINYTWNFGDDTGSLVTYSSFTVYRYKEDKNYTVTLTAENSVSRQVVITNVKLMKSCLNISFINNAPTLITLLTSFYGRVDQVGTESCYLFDLGNKTYSLYKSAANTTCQPELNVTDYHSFDVFVLNGNGMNITFQYLHVQTYFVQMIASNLVSRLYVRGTVPIVPLPCNYPVVRLPDTSGTFDMKTPFFKSEDILISSKCTVYCYASRSTLFKWQILRVSNAQDTGISYYPGNNAVIDQPNLVIRRRSLDYGQYKTCLNVSILNYPYIYKVVCSYIAVLPTPLRAIVYGGNAWQQSFVHNTVLDASLSHDPDVSENNASNALQYVWFFRKKGQNFTFTQNNLSNFTEEGNLTTEKPGRLAFTGKKLIIPQGVLKVNQSYEFMLYVRKDSRVSSYDVIIQVVDNKPPQMALVLNSYTQERVIPSGKTSFEGFCVTCNTSELENIQYEWELLKDIKNRTNEWRTLHNISSFVQSKLTGRFLVIKPNALEGGRRYKVRLIGKLPGQPQAFSELRLAIKKTPFGGNCSITPKSGRVLRDVFTLHCSGWHDDDDDGEDRKLYKFSFKTKPSDSEHLLQHMTKNTISPVLFPIGDEEWNYRLQIAVEIFDRYGASSKFPLRVEILDNMSTEDYLSFLENETNINGTLRTLEMEGYSQAITQYASTIGSWLTKNAMSEGKILSKLTEQFKKLQLSNTEVPQEETLRLQQQIDAEKKKIAISNNVSTNVRLKLSRALRAIQFDRLETVQQICGSVAILAGHPHEQVSLKVQRTLYDVVENCVDFASNRSSNTDAMFMAKVVTSEAHALGSILQSVAFVTSSSFNSTATNQTVEVTQERKLILDIMKLKKRISNGFMEKLSIGEFPTQLGSETLLLSLAKDYAADLNNASLRCGEARFELSSAISDYLIGANSTFLVIEEKASTTLYNPLVWDESSDLVNSQVTSLDISDGNSGAEISIINISQPFTIWVPRKGKINCLFTSINFQGTKYHTFELPRNTSAVNIEVRPTGKQKSIQFQLFIKKGSRPSKRFETLNKTIPENVTNSLDDPFVVLWSGEELEFLAGKIFVAVTYDGLRNRKEHDQDIPEEYLTANYTFCSYTSQCLFWDEEEEKWISKGCVVGPFSNSTHTQCLCNHLTNFASEFFVPPNAIDWDKISLTELLNNFVVTGVVLSIFGLYFIILIWARRKDRNDLAKTGVTPLPSNDPRDNYAYEIIVFTGHQSNAGTSSEVSVVLSGSLEETAPRILKDTDPKRIKFDRGSVDLFLLTVPHYLGRLRSIRLWHNHSGNSPSWYLERICVVDVQNGNKTWFVTNRWFALEEDDGQIERTLFPSSRDDLTKFNLLFVNESRRNLTDGHLWLSVYSRPIRSTFTRVQRLTCCLTVLLTTMVANAMFYEIGPSSSPKSEVKLGPIRISTQQISIAFISSLVVVPINTLVVMLFRKAKPAQGIENNLTTDPNGHSQKYVLQDDAIEGQLSGKENQNENKETKKKKNEKVVKDARTLPHWVVYIAYVAAFLACVTSAVFSIFYGLTFGKEKSERWISSMMLSFGQDVLISQPLKVVLMAVYFALVIKDPNKGEEDNPADLRNDEEWVHDRIFDNKLHFSNTNMVPKPPSEETLYHSRQIRTKEKQMVEVIKEMFFYGAFLLVLSIVAYGNRDSQAYPVKATMSDFFVESKYVDLMPISEVDDLFMFWEWVEYTFVPTLKPMYWYGPYTDPAEMALWTDQVLQMTRSKRRSRKMETKVKGGAQNVIKYVTADAKKYPKGFTADRATAYIVGVPRLRQLRVKHGCQLSPFQRNIFNACTPYYSWTSEERGAYVNNWKHFNYSKEIEKAKKKHDPWVWQSAWDLKGTPYWGLFATYWGGGFVANLGSDRLKTLKSMQVQELADWVDHRTRALFGEFTIYNPYVNVFCVVSLLTEVLPTGGYYHYNRVTPIKLYRYTGADQMVIMAFEILYISFLFVYTYNEFKQLFSLRKKYFNDQWNYIEIPVVVSSFCAIGLYFARMAFGKTAIDLMVENRETFVSFDYIALLDDWCTAMIGFAVYFSVLKLLKMLRFNKKMALMTRTVKACQDGLLSFLFLFLVVFLAYAQFAYLVFSTVSKSYSSFVSTIATLMSMTLGGFDYEVLESGNRILGRIFFFSYMMFVFLILVNVFLSIINDSFAEVSADTLKQANDFEILDFITLRVKEMIGVLRGPIIKPMYKLSKTKVEQELEDIQILSENIEYALRTMVVEELRQTNWLREVTARKALLVRLLLEIDFDFTEDDLSNAIPTVEKIAASFTDEELKDFIMRTQEKKSIKTDSTYDLGNVVSETHSLENEGRDTGEDSYKSIPSWNEDVTDPNNLGSLTTGFRSQSAQFEQQCEKPCGHLLAYHSVADIRTDRNVSRIEGHERIDKKERRRSTGSAPPIPKIFQANRSTLSDCKIATPEEFNQRRCSTSSKTTIPSTYGNWWQNTTSPNHSRCSVSDEDQSSSSVESLSSISIRITDSCEELPSLEQLFSAVDQTEGTTNIF